MTQAEPVKMMTKSELIAELAAQAGTSKAIIGRILDGLAGVAYREARHGFIIPGICKLGVTHRRARRSRNPRTGQALQIGEHDVVTIKPVKKARDLIAPSPDGLVTVLDAPPATTAAPPQEHCGDDAGAIVLFRCPECEQEIEAPCAVAGKPGECPSCGILLTVPRQSTAGIERAAAGAAAVKKSMDSDIQARLNRTIRIDLDEVFSMGGRKKP